MKIAPYVHTCIVRGATTDEPSKYLAEVTRWEYLDGTTCQHCGEPLATTEQLLAHIYAELTED